MTGADAGSWVVFAVAQGHGWEDGRVHSVGQRIALVDTNVDTAGAERIRVELGQIVAVHPTEQSAREGVARAQVAETALRPAWSAAVALETTLRRTMFEMAVNAAQARGEVNG